MLHMHNRETCVARNDELTIEERLTALEDGIADAKAQAMATATALDALCLELVAEHGFDGQRLAVVMTGLARKFAERNPQVESYLLKTAERIRTMHEAETVGKTDGKPAELGDLLGSIDTCITLHTRAVSQRMAETCGRGSQFSWALAATVFSGAAAAVLDTLLQDRSASAEIFALQLNLLASIEFEADPGQSPGQALEAAMQAAYDRFVETAQSQDGRLDEDTVGATVRRIVKDSPLLAVCARETSVNAAQLAWLGGPEFARLVIGAIAETSSHAVALARTRK